jgi:hypothetical protein
MMQMNLITLSASPPALSLERGLDLKTSKPYNLTP